MELFEENNSEVILEPRHRSRTSECRTSPKKYTLLELYAKTLHLETIDHFSFIF